MRNALAVGRVRRGGRCRHLGLHRQQFAAARSAGRRLVHGQARAAGSGRAGPAGALAFLPGPATRPRLLCARLQCPLDYRHPAGRKITLALDEVPPPRRPAARAC